MHKSFRQILLSLLSGFLLSSAWSPNKFTFLIFFALVPLLWIENAFRTSNVRHKNFKLFGLFYLSFVGWNSISTWWIINSTGFGAMIAILCNSLFMAVVWLMFHRVAKKVKPFLGYSFLIALWISFEFLHYNWELAWPWLTLGNSLAEKPQWIQWYEYTGVFGGSLWILLANIFLFISINKILKAKKISLQYVGISSVIIFLPLFFSIIKYNSHIDVGKPINVVIVQPNVDPYHEKFNGTGKQQLAKILQLASTVTDSSTDFIIAPETALPDGLWEENLAYDKNITTIHSFLAAFPNTAFVTGASTFRAYGKNEKRTATARKFKDADDFYDAFNTALQITSDEPLQVYHKSKLVPGVERMPYPSLFGFLDKYSIDMGGMSGSLGTQDDRSVFKHRGYKAAPIICYESIFGDFLSGYIRNEAGFFFIITNDGWWGNTAGHLQHLAYARLCAIEFRRSIARSTNTGISCAINQRGDVLQQTDWWKEDVFQTTIFDNDEKTFYSQHGDFIAKFFSIVTAVYLLFIIFKYLISLRVKTSSILKL
ncbi:MAG: apolipoprotein N-acyltransferase [Bacteroidia bacterium]|nr:apolipoprotein N-acyltransferase [Bacteroidia bacterium]